MKPVEISKGIYLVSGEKEGRFPFSHSFILKGDKTVLLDAGCGTSVMEEILETFDVDIIVLSHTHVDHFSSLSIAEDVPCIIPATSWETVKSIETLSRRFVKDEDARMEWLLMVKNLFGLKGFEPADVYRDGATISTGSHEIIAVSTPGHTKDHFAFFEEKTRLAFVFDIDLTPFGPWYGHEESDISDFLTSIQRIRDLKPSCLLSSHRDPLFEGWEEELTEYEEHIYRRDEQVEEMVRAGDTLGDMIEKSVIYGGYPHVPKLLMYFEKVMLLKHVERLGLTGKLKT